MSSVAKIERPPFACEISANAVSAARGSVGGGGVEIVHSRTLPKGAVIPSLTNPNLLRPDVVREAIQETISAVAGNPRDIIAVVPDAAARVVLLDFDTLPEKREEAEPVVRFRLKKSLPFDVDKSVVSFESYPSEKGTRVVAAMMLRTVLDEYESVFRDAGYSPGVVLPSTLAALGAIEGDRPTLLLKLDDETSSVAIVNGDQLLLHRTQEAGGEYSAERLAEDVYPSLIYFQDTFGVTIERVLVCGWNDMNALTPMLVQQTSARVEPLLDSIAVSGARAEACGAIGALL
jgi:type IV pilus assembly protein PilM